MKSRELEITLAMYNPYKTGERVKQTFSMKRTIGNYDYMRSSFKMEHIKDIMEDMLEQIDAVSKAESDGI